MSFAIIIIIIFSDVFLYFFIFFEKPNEKQFNLFWVGWRFLTEIINVDGD
jgi:hypothetical protein